MEIRRCQSADINDLMLFIDTHWRQNHVLATSRELMDWQHGNPDGSYNYLLAEEQGEIRGVLGFIPASRYDAALAHDDILWLALWKVREDCKTPMLGIRLLNALQKLVPHSGIAVSGIGPSLPALYRPLGYDIIELTQYYMVNPACHQTLIGNSAGRPLPRPQNGQAVMREMHESDLRSLAVEMPDAMAHKTPAYFLNRFIRHPFYRYRVFLLEHADYKALIATRTARHGDAAALRIVDFSGAPQALAHCGTALSGLMAEDNAEYIDFWQHGLPDEALRAAGFQPAEPGVTVPNFYEPFVRANAHITCATKLPHLDSIVICRADGDQDRPNQLPLAA